VHIFGHTFFVGWCIPIFSGTLKNRTADLLLQISAKSYASAVPEAGAGSSPYTGLHERIGLETPLGAFSIRLMPLKQTPRSGKEDSSGRS
jgi:hypothetical protein